MVQRKKGGFQDHINAYLETFHILPRLLFIYNFSQTLFCKLLQYTFLRNNVFQALFFVYVSEKGVGGGEGHCIYRSYERQLGNRRNTIRYIV